jgi:hypothetical protein
MWCLVFQLKVAIFYYFQNNFSSDLEMFNPLLNIVQSHKEVQIPSGTLSLEPISNKLKS